ncbi:hypothetical protein P5673_005168 [Acropora cervicornis]|uniref:Uncharacterized protein n=1 Tax=Acropora cervicornis TaxID=6130 RepID=A0AAD9QZJ9_ACRCE|nr:hypothetical protein P5673_005168 [Acropora cervicornis]
MIKTRTSRVEDLTEFVKTAHPYEVPEVINVKVHVINLLHRIM